MCVCWGCHIHTHTQLNGLLPCVHTHTHTHTHSECHTHTGRRKGIAWCCFVLLLPCVATPLLSSLLLLLLPLLQPLHSALPPPPLLLLLHLLLHLLLLLHSAPASNERGRAPQTCADKRTMAQLCNGRGSNSAPCDPWPTFSWRSVSPLLSQMT